MEIKSARFKHPVVDSESHDCALRRNQVLVLTKKAHPLTSLITRYPLSSKLIISKGLILPFLCFLDVSPVCALSVVKCPRIFNTISVLRWRNR